MNPAIRISASRRGFLRLLPAGLLARMDRASAVPRPPASDFQVEATPLFARVDGRLKRMLAATIKSPDTAAAYGVSSIPTVMIFKNGDAVERFVGVQPKSRLQQAIDQAKA
jgi:thiol-disulfide isomerase/thioredoxin